MKKLLLILLMVLVISCQQSDLKNDNLFLMSVNGPISRENAGLILEHEHILVDFSGADGYDPEHWNDDSVSAKVLPYLKEAMTLGCGTLIDATPQFLGRDAILLKNISDRSGLNVITNTGLYGAVDRKFLPEYAHRANTRQLADIWIQEFKKGIEGTNIKPGFIKISVNPGSLGDVERKLVEAACITHKATGLTIASHTGPAIPAFEELEILKKYQIDPSAFIWVHAQNEENWGLCVEAARKGAWVAFDGLNDENVAEYIERINFMKKNSVIDRLLISHDAGWYDPDKPGGGEFRPFNTVFNALIPKLTREGYSQKEIDQIFKTNPFEAFAVRVKFMPAGN